VLPEPDDDVADQARTFGFVEQLVVCAVHDAQMHVRVGVGTTTMPVTEVASVVTRVTDLVAPASENEYAMGEPA